MTTSDFAALGQDLTARYALGALLGKGGFGSVHRARDLAAGRDVAIKLLTTTSGGAVDRFLREAAVAATLEHPHLIKVHAAGLHGGRAAIVYELVEGETFSSATRTLPPRARAELVRDAARAVGHAHARGVVHRDLKPDNLLVGRDGRVRVADFGLVWHEGAEQLTRTGAILGTPAYMAPELFESGERVRASAAADVWALGVVLYEALAGRSPFAATDLIALMGQVQHAPIARPRSVDPSVDRALEAVCLRALDRDPARRFADAEALAQALDDALEGRSPPSSGRAVRVVAALALLAVVAAGVAIWHARATSSRADTGPSATPTTTERAAATSGTPALSDGPLTDRTLFQAPGARWALWVDARRVLTGGPDDDVRLWDAASGAALRAWDRPATSACRLGPGRVVLGSDTGLHALSIDDGEVTALGRFVTASLVATSAAGTLAALGTTADGQEGVFVLSPDGRRRAASVPLAHGRPASLALSADGAWLAVGLRGREDAPADAAALALGTIGPIVTFTVDDRGVVLRNQVTVPGYATSLAFSSEGDLLCGTNVGQIGWIPRGRDAVMAALEPVPGRASNAHEGPVHALAFRPDGSLLTLAGQDGDLVLSRWTYPGHQQLGTTYTFGEAPKLGADLVAPGAPRTLDVSLDGRAVAIGTEGGGVHVRVLEPTAAAAPPPLTDRQLVQASSPRWAVWVDARRILTGGDDDDLRLWEAATGAELRAWPLRARAGIRTAPGRVALGAATGVYVLDAGDGAGALRELGRFSDVQQVACAELTGQLAVIGHTSGVAGYSVSLVSPSGERRGVPLPSDRRQPLAVAVSRDGKRLAVSLGEAGADAASSEFESMMIGVAGTVLLYTADGAIRSRHSAVVPGRATVMRFNAAGTELLVGSNLGQLGVIPFEQGEVMGEFFSAATPKRAFATTVRDLRLLPDLARLFALADAEAPDGAELKVWSYPGQSELRTLTAPGRARSLDIAPDGRAAVIGTHAHGVHVRVVTP